jgi:hypothetical protein
MTLRLCLCSKVSRVFLDSSIEGHTNGQVCPGCVDFSGRHVAGSKNGCASVDCGDFAVDATYTMSVKMWDLVDGNLRRITSPEVRALADYRVTGVIHDDGAIGSERTRSALLE